MDNFELLSDDELRIKLLQYGFENLPITQTTRRTLIKKLRNHLASANSNLRKNTTLATRYSSGEDSDPIDSKKKVDALKTRKSRLTLSGGRNSDNQMPPPSFIRSDQTSTSSYSRNINNSVTKKSSVYVSPVIINDSEDDDIDWSVQKNRNNFKNVPLRSSDLYSTLDSSQRTLNGNNGYNQEEVDDSNSISDYTRRLLQFREGNIQKQNSNTRKRPTYTSQRLSDYQPVSENDIVHHSEPSLEPAHISLTMAIKNFITRLDAAYGFKQTFVPMVLVTFLIVFFLLIIFVYVTISPNILNVLNPSTTLYVSCTSQHEADSSYTCIEEKSVAPTLSFLKILAPELQTRAVAQRCGDKSSGLSNIMCVKELWQYLSDNQQQSHYREQNSDGTKMLKDVHNIEYLIDCNKQWGIQNVNDRGEPITLEEVVELRAHKANCFAILRPKLPITCTIYNKLQTFFFIIGALAIISVAVFIVRKFCQFILQVKEKRRQQVDIIIREICSTLTEKSIQDKENPSVVLNHLRDKIIEPSKRSELAWAWKEAIGYLEQNDSRIHFGIETVNGENFKVIRWIDDVKNLTAPGSGIHAFHVSQPQPQSHQQQRFSSSKYIPQADGRPYGTLKKWMGSAFDKSNKIKDPPTNCLKIRQMFDKYEANNPNLQVIIQDTILLKLCEKNCKIFDIQLDVKTCCVYVKCASCADAGIVHEEINGWWLDAGLVVVKFLKQDKYHQRFPKSISACISMKPSSNVYITQNDAGSNGHDDYFDEEIDDDDDFE